MKFPTWRKVSVGLRLGRLDWVNMIDSLRLFNIAMGNVPFVDDYMHDLSIKHGDFPVVESPYGVILSSIFPIFTHSKKEFVRSLFVIYDIYIYICYITIQNLN